MFRFHIVLTALLCLISFEVVGGGRTGGFRAHSNDTYIFLGGPGSVQSTQRNLT